MDATSSTSGPRVSGDAYFREYEHCSLNVNSVLANRFPRFVKTDAPIEGCVRGLETAIAVCVSDGRGWFRLTPNSPSLW